MNIASHRSQFCFETALARSVSRVVEVDEVDGQMEEQTLPPAVWSVAETMWTLVLAAVCLAGAVPAAGSHAGIEVPVWLQPGMLGLFWGGLYLIGFWAGGTRGLSLASACTLGLAAFWLTYSIQSLTDFSYHQSLLVSALAVASGWVTFRKGCPLAAKHWKNARLSRLQQWSLGDAFMVMTVAACAASGMARFTGSPALFFSVLATVLIGCCWSWAAVDWAWNDRTPIGLPLAISILMTALGMAAVSWWAPSMTFGQRLEWAVSGPLSGCAAQSVTVLVAVALIRQNVPRSAHCKLASNSTVSLS
jgi:hypothetical protein